MSEQNTRVVRRALEEVFAGGNLAAVDDIFHRAFVKHEAGPRTPVGPEGLKMTVAWIRSSFSDLRYDIKDEIVEGDKVVVRLISSGRHTGEFIGFPPTGKTFSVEQIHIYRIAEGRIIEHWSSRDDLSQGMQLGFIPTGRGPGPAPAAEEEAQRSSSLATVSDILVGGGKIFPADHVVITQPQEGVFRVFSSTCTHLGCTVVDVSGGLIKCPCHGSEFTIADGSVHNGPAAEPLRQFAAKVDGGEISIA